MERRLIDAAGARRVPDAALDAALGAWGATSELRAIATFESRMRVVWATHRYNAHDAAAECEFVLAALAAAERARSAAALAWAPDASASLTGLVTGNPGFAPDGTFVVGKVEATWRFDGGYTSSRVRAAGTRGRSWRRRAAAITWISGPGGRPSAWARAATQRS